MAFSTSLPSYFLPFLLFLLLLTTTEARRRTLTTITTPSQFLNPQNAVRAQLGLPPLQWSSKLTTYAEWYANRRRGDCTLTHSAGNYGENLFWGKGKRWTVADAVAAWAAEKSSYDYRGNACLPGTDCLHYTQMVWRVTARVGCARIVCNSGDTFVACEYDPHGNVIGQRPY